MTYQNKLQNTSYIVWIYKFIIQYEWIMRERRKYYSYIRDCYLRIIKKLEHI